MDGNPPIGYHVWHVYLRAMMFLDIDWRRWRELDPMIAYAWALQSVAKPDPNKVNLPLPHKTVSRLAAAWLPRTPEQLDVAFQSFPYPPGTS